MLFLRKNLILIIGMMVILGTHLVSCCKEPLPPVIEPEELEPTLELSITPEGVIPYGEGSVVINFQTKDANQVLVNGVRKPSVKLGTHTIKEKLFKDTTLVVKAINIKKMVEKSVTIQVGDWTTSTFGLVSYYPWKYKALSVSSFEGEILDYWIPDPELLSWVFYYHRDGKISYSFTEEIASWLIEGDTIFQNREPFKLQVNQNEMILSYQTMYNGELIWFDMVFEHASDTPTDPD